MLQRHLRDITQGLYGRLFLSRCMQVLARRKTGVVLKEQTTRGPGEDCPFLLVFVVPLQANWRTKSKFDAINNTFSGVNI